MSIEKSIYFLPAGEHRRIDDSHRLMYPGITAPRGRIVAPFPLHASKSFRKMKNSGEISWMPVYLDKRFLAYLSENLREKVLLMVQKLLLSETIFPIKGSLLDSGMVVDDEETVNTLKDIFSQIVRRDDFGASFDLTFLFSLDMTLYLRVFSLEEIWDIWKKVRVSVHSAHQKIRRRNELDIVLLGYDFPQIPSLVFGMYHMKEIAHSGILDEDFAERFPDCGDPQLEEWEMMIRRSEEIIGSVAYGEGKVFAGRIRGHNWSCTDLFRVSNAIMDRLMTIRSSAYSGVPLNECGSVARNPLRSLAEGVIRHYGVSRQGVSAFIANAPRVFGDKDIFESIENASLGELILLGDSDLDIPPEKHRALELASMLEDVCLLGFDEDSGVLKRLPFSVPAMSVPLQTRERTFSRKFLKDFIGTQDDSLEYYILTSDGAPSYNSYVVALLYNNLDKEEMRDILDHFMRRRGYNIAGFPTVSQWERFIEAKRGEYKDIPYEISLSLCSKKRRQDETWND